MARYYKATRPDGTDFRTGTIRYEVGQEVVHPCARKVRDDPSTYLSVATVPTDCTGMRWPCRLFVVEGIGRPLRAEGLPNKRCFSRLRVVEELPAHEVFGPQGVEVVTLIERAARLTSTEAELLAAASAAWSAAFKAAWDAARFDAAWSAARCAAGALVVRDLISPEQFDVLYGPWASVMEGGK